MPVGEVDGDFVGHHLRRGGGVEKGCFVVVEEEEDFSIGLECEGEGAGVDGVVVGYEAKVDVVCVVTVGVAIIAVVITYTTITIIIRYTIIITYTTITITSPTKRQLRMTTRRWIERRRRKVGRKRKQCVKRKRCSEKERRYSKESGGNGNGTDSNALGWRSIDTKSHNERRRYRSILVRSRDVKDERMTRTSVMGLR